MNQSCTTSNVPGGMPIGSTPGYPDPSQWNSQVALLDIIFPGFSILSSAVLKYSKIDLTIYIPLFLALGLTAFASSYVKTWVWDALESYVMSTADIRVDDEMYNMLMAWVADQSFAKTSRRFVANTNLNSRFWYLWDDDDDDKEDKDDEAVEFDEDSNPVIKNRDGKKDKKVRFTPSFGTHYFWYKRRLLVFSRQQDTRQTSWGPVSEREEITISSFGRDPTILKTLLDECRTNFLKNDENRTVIYRGSLKSGTAEPQWTRCVSRVSRPFSTVVLDETVKKNLLDDMRDYLHPYTRRWYSNRGIPYRRGYLLYGPPGTGKSSLSFAIAGYFKLKIYIVSLNSLAMTEENLGTLFSELPKQCVVLLEDIDTAGLTHTRDAPVSKDTEGEAAKPLTTTLPANTVISPAQPPANNTGGRISLSALLNILDGVASQEGRILIMTTNHLEKLDEALIRPGRVDMTIKFDLANKEMIKTIFRAIFATLEGDIPASATPSSLQASEKGISIRTPQKSSSTTFFPGAKTPPKLSAAALKLKEAEDKKILEEFLERKKKEDEKVEILGEGFAGIIPGMMFSPAEIQGFLLKYKREPEVAVKEAGEWVRIMGMEKKKEKEKIEREEKEAKEKEEKEKVEAEKKAEEEKKAAEEKKVEDEKKAAEKEKKIDDEKKPEAEAKSEAETKSEEKSEGESKSNEVKRDDNEPKVNGIKKDDV